MYVLLRIFPVLLFLCFFNFFHKLFQILYLFTHKGRSKFVEVHTVSIRVFRHKSFFEHLRTFVVKKNYGTFLSVWFLLNSEEPKLKRIWGRKHRFFFRGSRGLQRVVVYLGRPIAPLYMSPNAWGGGGEICRGLSQWVQLYSPNKLWTFESIFHLCSDPVD